MGTPVNGPSPIPASVPAPISVPVPIPVPVPSPRPPRCQVSRPARLRRSANLPPFAKMAAQWRHFPSHLPASSEGWANGRPLPTQSGAVIGQPARQSSLGLKPSRLCRVDGPSGGGRARFGGEGRRGPAVPGEGEGCRAGGAAVTGAGGARGLQGPGRWAAGTPRPAAVTDSPGVGHPRAAKNPLNVP